MREKIARFMVGRNGTDDLARAEMVVTCILALLSVFLHSYTIPYTICSVLFWALFIHTYFRVLSRNVSRRYEENQKFLNFRYDAVVKKNKAQRRAEQKKIYRYFKCPMCKQEVRVPKGHGKIEITCPKCREHFIRRS